MNQRGSWNYWTFWHDKGKPHSVSIDRVFNNVGNLSYMNGDYKAREIQIDNGDAYEVDINPALMGVE